MSKLSRTKGHSFEREVAIALRRIFPNAKRHLEYQQSEAKGFDIDGTFPFLFQCKRGRKPSPISAIDEIKASSPEHVPVLVTKGDRGETYAVLPFEDFLDLVHKGYITTNSKE